MAEVRSAPWVRPATYPVHLFLVKSPTEQWNDGNNVYNNNSNKLTQSVHERNKKIGGDKGVSQGIMFAYVSQSVPVCLCFCACVPTTLTSEQKHATFLLWYAQIGFTRWQPLTNRPTVAAITITTRNNRSSDEQSERQFDTHRYYHHHHHQRCHTSSLADATHRRGVQLPLILPLFLSSESNDY